MNGRSLNFLTDLLLRRSCSVFSTISEALRKCSIKGIQWPAFHKIERSSSLTPPGSMPIRQNKFKASGYSCLIVKVEASKLTLSFWVGSRPYTSLMKSPESIMLKSILYRSVRERFPWRKGATKVIENGCPPSKVHKWWSARLKLPPFASTWDWNGVPPRSFYTFFYSKSSLISSDVMSLRAFFSRSSIEN